MIPEKVNVKDVESTVTGDVIGMTIDEASMEHIMGLLTDMYSDPELAVLREYSTNALDAQREIGETRPIEISLPNALSPFLLIRDFGVGLSVSDIHTIYSKYGASTKRGTNDQVGMLGLGCKSALTYADQFTVTSVQNGTRVQVVVSRNAKGAATMTVVETSATDDHSGTTVMVPAKRYNEFERKAHKFFRFWEPGTVLIDGDAPVPVSGLKVTDDIMISSHDTSGVEQSYVVMGNVAYPWKDPDHGLAYNYHLVARVPIGSVTFPPSREELMYEDEVTNPTLRKVSEEFKKHVPEALVNAIEAAETMKEALQLRIKWNNVISHLGITPNWTYKGVAIPATINSTYVPPQNVRDDTAENGMRYVPASGHQFVVTEMHANRMSSHSKAISIRIADVPSTLWIEGYDRPTFTAGQKKKINHLYDNDLYDTIGGVHKVVLVRDSLEPSVRQWIESDRIIQWSRVAAVKLPQNRAQSSSGKIPGSFDFYTKDKLCYNIPGDDLGTRAASYPLYWISGNHHVARPYYQGLRADGKDFSLVCLPANRVEKFKRTFPAAKNVNDVIKDRWEAWWKTVTPVQREALALRSYHSLHKHLQGIDPARVKDPAIRQAIEASLLDVDTLVTALQGFTRLNSNASAAIDEIGFTDPFSSYALLEADNFTDTYYGRTRDKDQMYRYLNNEYDFQCAKASC